jgi:hypothetical protein
VKFVVPQSLIIDADKQAKNSEYFVEAAFGQDIGEGFVAGFVDDLVEKAQHLVVVVQGVFG